jgi:tetratricopeptide (TPR) repeat protein
MNKLAVVLFYFPLLPAADCEARAAMDRLEQIRSQVEGGKEREARKEYRRLAKQQRGCASDIRAGNNLADMAIRLGLREEALRFAETVVESSARQFGPRSIPHAVSLETLAQALALSRREAEAERHIRTAISICEEQGGKESLFYSGLWNVLGTLHARLDDPEGALRQFERAWAIVERHPEQELYVVVLHNLAATSHRLGREDEARIRMAEVQQRLEELPPSLRRGILTWSPLSGSLR